MKKDKRIIHGNMQNDLLEMDIDEMINKSLAVLDEINIDEQVKLSEEIGETDKSVTSEITLEKAEIDLRNIEISSPHLDIGGSGEKIIYRAVCPKKLTIIDVDFDDIINNSRAECYKMDASNMEFDDNTFQTITSFYTFLYMNEDKIRESIKECFRVLRAGGLLYIWDVCLSSVKQNNIVFAPLRIQYKNKVKEVTYGSSEVTLTRNQKFYLDILHNSGFSIRSVNINDNSILLVAQKEILCDRKAP